MGTADLSYLTHTDIRTIKSNKVISIKNFINTEASHAYRSVLSSFVIMVLTILITCQSTQCIYIHKTK